MSVHAGGASTLIWSFHAVGHGQRINCSSAVSVVPTNCSTTAGASKVTRRNLSQEKQRSSVSGPPKRFSPSFVRMLHEALENGRLSARKAAKAMGLGLGGLTELFAQYDLAAPFEL